MQSRETQITMVKWTNAGGQTKRANERSFVYRPPAWRRWRNVKTTYGWVEDELPRPTFQNAPPPPYCRMYCLFIIILLVNSFSWSLLVYVLHKKWNKAFSSPSRTKTGKKRTKKCNARAKLFCLIKLFFFDVLVTVRRKIEILDILNALFGNRFYLFNSMILFIWFFLFISLFIYLVAMGNLC